MIKNKKAQQKLINQKLIKDNKSKSKISNKISTDTSDKNIKESKTI